MRIAVLLHPCAIASCSQKRDQLATPRSGRLACAKRSLQLRVALVVLVVLAVQSAAGCGRLGFDELCSSTECASEQCGDGIRNGLEVGVDCGGACPACPVGTPCELDSDCASGVCDLECINSSANRVYYSVGDPAQLQRAFSVASVSSGILTFDGPESPRIGVGDEVLIGSDYVVYISGRISSSEFSVTTAKGDLPQDHGVATVVVRRAFDELAAAVEKVVDPLYLGSTDLVASGVQLNFAVYADRPLAREVIIDDFVTDRVHYVRVFAPHGPDEVGQSQVHRGRRGSGAVIRPNLSGPTGGFHHIAVYVAHVRLEGLEIDGSQLDLGRHVAGVLVDAADNSVIRLDRLLIHDIRNSSVDETVNDGDVYGIRVASGNVAIRNTMIFGLEQLNSNSASGVDGIRVSAPAGHLVTIRNVTIFDAHNTVGPGSVDGLSADELSGPLEAYNTVVMKLSGGATRCFEGPFVQSHNVASDNTASGDGSLTGKTGYASYFLSTTAGAEDLHLLGPSSALWGGAGLDLRNDDQAPILLDIDGQVRDEAPDIGADEFGPAFSP